MIDPHVLASFTDRADAFAAVDATSQRFREGRARLGDADDDLDVLALGQQREAGEPMPIIGGGLFTGPFARGALVWGLAGIVAGAVVGALMAVFFEPDWVAPWLLVVAFAR